MKWNELLIRYGELSLKGRNRSHFVRRLKKNIETALIDLQSVVIKPERDRMYLFADDHDDMEEAIKRLPHVFGIQSFSPVAKCETTMEDIYKTAINVVGSGETEGKTFKVEIRRTDKSFPYVTQTIRNAELEVRRYPLLEVTIDEHRPFYCLNEFSIRSNIIRTFVLDVIIDGRLFEVFLGDGLIISTPTGSTAYNKSVNGAVVDPLLECYQVTELASVNNNKYRTLGSSFILSGDRKLRLRVHQDGNDFPLMAADNEAQGIRQVENIDIQLSKKTIKTVKLKDNSFWEKVQRIFL